MKQLKVIFATVAILVSALVSADATLTYEDKVLSRIAPVGSVCTGSDCGGAPVVAGPRSGEEIYNGACGACHGVGILGAPKNGDKGAWDARLAKGLDQTWQNAINGINAMPAMGNCASCDNDDILSAIKYMAGI